MLNSFFLHERFSKTFYLRGCEDSPRDELMIMLIRGRWVLMGPDSCLSRHPGAQNKWTHSLPFPHLNNSCTQSMKQTAESILQNKQILLISQALFTRLHNKIFTFTPRHLPYLETASIRIMKRCVPHNNFM